MFDSHRHVRGRSLVLVIAAVLAGVSISVPVDVSAASAPTWMMIESAGDVGGTTPSTLVTYDAADGYLLLARGYPSTSMTFSGGRWTNVSLATYPGLGSGGMTYDAADGYVVYQGGTGSPHWDHMTGDTVKFAAGQWVGLTPSGPPRCCELMAYDESSGNVVMFGGYDGPLGLQPLNDTWTYRGGTWTPVTPAVSPPLSASAGSMAYDSADGYTVLFGGTDCSRSNCTFLDETWTFSSGRWTKSSPLISPSPRAWASMAYDAANGYVLLFGGWGPQGATLDDTWSFHDGEWVQLDPAASPSPRAAAPVAYDPGSSRVVMVGGFNGSTSYGETWAYGAPPGPTSAYPLVLAASLAILAPAVGLYLVVARIRARRTDRAR